MAYQNGAVSLAGRRPLFSSAPDRGESRPGPFPTGRLADRPPWTETLASVGGRCRVWPVSGLPPMKQGGGPRCRGERPDLWIGGNLRLVRRTRRSAQPGLEESPQEKPTRGARPSVATGTAALRNPNQLDPRRWSLPEGRLGGQGRKNICRGAPLQGLAPKALLTSHGGREAPVQRHQSHQYWLTSLESTWPLNRVRIWDHETPKDRIVANSTPTTVATALGLLRSSRP